jgi:hypothetical protein
MPLTYQFKMFLICRTGQAMKFIAKLCVKLCVNLPKISCITPRFFFLFLVIAALAGTRSAHSMRPQRPKRTAANLEAVLALLGDEEDDGQDPEFFADISRELEGLERQLERANKRPPGQSVRRKQRASRAQAQQPTKIRNRNAEFAQDGEEKEISEHENTEVGNLLNNLFAGSITREEALRDEYLTPLSLSPEEESELLGNPDPSSPTGSPQMVRGFHPSSLRTVYAPERPRTPKAGSSPQFHAMPAAHTPTPVHATPVAQLLASSPMLRAALAPQQARITQRAPSTPRNHAMRGLPCVIASIDPGKTGDLGGDVMDLYATHQS